MKETNLHKKFKVKEDELIELISKTDNLELMDIFNDWMELRNQLNEKTLVEIIDILDSEYCITCHEKFSELDIKLKNSRPKNICVACFTSNA